MLSFLESFNRLFDQWANEAVQVASFPAKKPRHERIPDAVKAKAAILWEKGICYQDPKPASFRITDAKGGGPYQWFSYYPSNRMIYTNHEYFVQVAAFYDLIHKYGYPTNWMVFEHNESVPPVSLAIDIGIKFPDGRKAFVEVKERREQWETLIAQVKSIGERGVNFDKPDRGKDPLRKAKYILAGQPDFFSGYFGDSFDTYKVIFVSDGRFTLEPDVLPNAQSFVGHLPANR